MNLDQAQARAQKVTTPKQAATLYNDVEYELAMGDPDPAQEQNGERALSILEERFPGVRDQARDVDQPPALSRAGGRNLNSSTAGGGSSARRSAPRRGGSPAGGGSSGGGRRGGHPRRSPTPPASSSGGRSSGSSSSSGSSRRASSGGRSRSSSSSGPGLSDLVPGFDATDSALFVIRAILLLGVGYFLLSKRGSSALSTVLGGLSTGVRLIVSPVDPIGKAAATVAPGSPVPTISVPGTTSAPAASLAGGNNPRGTTILGGGLSSSPGSTAKSMAGKLIPLPPSYPTGLATGSLSSHIRQSVGPFGGGSTQ